LGTGIAAAVAQTSLQAQQEARRRDRRANTSSSDAGHTRDIYEKLLEVFEERQDTESSPRLTIEEQLPDHQSPPQQQARKKPTQPLPPPPVEQMPDLAIAPAVPVIADRHRNTAKPDQLYRHLDIEA
jgi:hypothetical protein